MLYLRFISPHPQRSAGGLAPPSYEYAVNIPLKAIKFRHYQNTSWLSYLPGLFSHWAGLKPGGGGGGDREGVMGDG